MEESRERLAEKEKGKFYTLQFPSGTTVYRRKDLEFSEDPHGWQIVGGKISARGSYDQNPLASQEVSSWEVVKQLKGPEGEDPKLFYGGETIEIPKQVLITNATVRRRLQRRKKSEEQKRLPGFKT